jgi:UDP-N-acetylmuramyl pentapeptide phosphotransferase/UDP-N-acetylglucosamine-1-phosphate transferase
MIHNMGLWYGWIAPRILLICLSAGISAGLIVLLRPILVRYALARPNARSSHHEPTPQGGGIAVILATITSFVLWEVVASGTYPTTQALLVMAAAVIIAIVGAVDDIRTIAAGPRLLLQALIVILVVASLPAEARPLPMLPWWVERILMVFAGVWYVNLVNFMDGIDWMTVAAFLPMMAGLALFGMIGALPQSDALMAISLLGALLGFAPFNRPIARLFLGDVGSLPIGLLSGWLLFLLAANGHFIAALLLPLYYLADATLTLLCRLKNGERVWQAHRTHFYQRATDNGLTVLQTVSRVFAVNVGLAMLATATVLLPSIAINVAATLLGIALVYLLIADFMRKRIPSEQTQTPHAASPVKSGTTSRNTP